MKCRSTAAFILLLLTSLIPDTSSLGVQPRSIEAIHIPPYMSDFINIWSDSVDNTQPAVAYNSLHDEFLVVWVTYVSDDTAEIWGQRVSSDGILLEGGWFNIDAVDEIRLIRPTIAYSPQADQYLVAYACDQASGNFDIWGRVIDWDGTRHSRLYLDTGPLDQFAPSLAYNTTSSHYLLAYQNIQSDGSYSIELRRINTNGAISDTHSLTSPPGEYRKTPALVYNPSQNGFFLVYGLESISDFPKIIGRTVSADLSLIGPEYDNTDSINYGIRPSVALGEGEYLVTWYDTIKNNIFARRADLDGLPLGPAGGMVVAYQVPGSFQSYPRVERAGPYGFLITWNVADTLIAGKSDIYGRYVGFGKDQPHENSFAIDARPNFQGGVALTCTPGGLCLVVDTHNPFDYPLGDLEISGRLIQAIQVYLPLAMR